MSSFPHSERRPFTPANGVVHDEDVFTGAVQLPKGKAKPGPGIGKK